MSNEARDRMPSDIDPERTTERSSGGERASERQAAAGQTQDSDNRGFGIERRSGNDRRQNPEMSGGASDQS